MTHSLLHAIYGCTCERSAIDRCVICGAHLDLSPHVDTCGKRCFRTLLRKQREAPPLPEVRPELFGEPGLVLLAIQESNRELQSVRGTTIYPTHRCFDDALEFLVHPRFFSGQSGMEALMRAYVVHGICLADDDSPYAHGWAELDGLAWQGGLIDGVHVYYAMPVLELRERLRVRECTRYTVPEASRHNVATGHYGPWDPKYRELTSASNRVWKARDPK